MKQIGAVILLLVTVSALSACDKRVPVENVTAAPLGASADATLEQVTAMIEQTCFRRGWEVLEKQPGRMTAMLSVSGGKHRVTANIAYDTKSFSISYVDSQNMNYRTTAGTGQIHPKYNIWVNQLRQDIEANGANL